MRTMRLYIRLCQLVGWLVGWLVGQLLPYLIFWPFFAFSAYCSCLSAQVTLSITAPAHPHMIGVTINPDFSFFFSILFFLSYAVFALKKF